MYERISRDGTGNNSKGKNGYTSGRKRNWGVKAILCGNARVLALNFLWGNCCSETGNGVVDIFSALHHCAESFMIFRLRVFRSRLVWF